MSHRIVYLNWSPSEITGGIKFAFRCVDILRERGFNAVVATQNAELPKWFESPSPVIDLEDIRPDHDALVFPENHSRWLSQFSDCRNPKVIFCQNPYYAFRGLGDRSGYGDFGVTHILCLGSHTASICRKRYPALSVLTVTCFIDHQLFFPQSTKRLQIAFMPKKRPTEAMFIQDMLRATSKPCREMPWIAIEYMSEERVASVLRESAVFLSLSRMEAYAFNILEAMSCGCVVAGFTGIGAQEYTTLANGFFAPEDDCMACAAQLQEAVNCAIGGGPFHRSVTGEAIATGRRYNRTRFAQGLVEAWEQIAKDLNLEFDRLPDSSGSRGGNKENGEQHRSRDHEVPAALGSQP